MVMPTASATSWNASFRLRPGCNSAPGIPERLSRRPLLSEDSPGRLRNLVDDPGGDLLDFLVGQCLKPRL